MADSRGDARVRVFLPKCWFDAEKCARGIDALRLYCLCRSL
jgi:hypothetical protein